MNEEKVAIMRARKAAAEARWAGVSKRQRSRQMKAVRAKRRTQAVACALLVRQVCAALGHPARLRLLQAGGKYPKKP